MSLLHQAIRNHETITAIQEILRAHPEELRKQDPITGMSSLQHAAMEGRIDILLLLCERKDFHQMLNAPTIQLDAKKPQNFPLAEKPALLLAIENGHWLVAQVLLALGAKKNHPDLVGLKLDSEVFNSLLHRAVELRSERLLNLLLQRISNETKSTTPDCKGIDIKVGNPSTPLLPRSPSHLIDIDENTSCKINLNSLEIDLKSLAEQWPENIALQRLYQQYLVPKSTLGASAGSKAIVAAANEKMSRDEKKPAASPVPTPTIDEAIKKNDRQLLLRIILASGNPPHKIALRLAQDFIAKTNKDDIPDYKILKEWLDKFFNLISLEGHEKNSIIYHIISLGLIHSLREARNPSVVWLHKCYLNLMRVTQEQFITVYLKFLQKSNLAPQNLRLALQAKMPQCKSLEELHSWLKENQLYTKTICRMMVNHFARFGMNDSLNNPLQALLALSAEDKWQPQFKTLQSTIAPYLETKDQIRWSIANNGFYVAPFSATLLIDQFIGTINFEIRNYGLLRYLKETTWKQKLYMGGSLAGTALFVTSAMAWNNTQKTYRTLQAIGADCTSGDFCDVGLGACTSSFCDEYDAANHELVGWITGTMASGIFTAGALMLELYSYSHAMSVHPSFVIFFRTYLSDLNAKPLINISGGLVDFAQRVLHNFAGREETNGLHVQNSTARQFKDQLELLKTNLRGTQHSLFKCELTLPSAIPATRTGLVATKEMIAAVSADFKSALN